MTPPLKSVSWISIVTVGAVIIVASIVSIAVLLNAGTINVLTFVGVAIAAVAIGTILIFIGVGLGPAVVTTTSDTSSTPQLPMTVTWTRLTPSDGGIEFADDTVKFKLGFNNDLAVAIQSSDVSSSLAGAVVTVTTVTPREYLVLCVPNATGELILTLDDTLISVQDAASLVSPGTTISPEPVASFAASVGTDKYQDSTPATVSLNFSVTIFGYSVGLVSGTGVSGLSTGSIDAEGADVVPVTFQTNASVESKLSVTGTVDMGGRNRALAGSPVEVVLVHGPALEVTSFGIAEDYSRLRGGTAVPWELVTNLPLASMTPLPAIAALGGVVTSLTVTSTYRAACTVTATASGQAVTVTMDAGLKADYVNSLATPAVSLTIPAGNVLGDLEVTIASGLKLPVNLSGISIPITFSEPMRSDDLTWVVGSDFAIGNDVVLNLTEVLPTNGDPTTFKLICESSFAQKTGSVQLTATDKTASAWAPVTSNQASNVAAMSTVAQATVTLSAVGTDPTNMWHEPGIGTSTEPRAVDGTTEMDPPVLTPVFASSAATAGCVVTSSVGDGWKAFRALPIPTAVGDNGWDSGAVYNATTGAYTGATTTNVSPGVDLTGEWVQVQLASTATLGALLIYMDPRLDPADQTNRPGLRQFELIGSATGQDDTWESVTVSGNTDVYQDKDFYSLMPASLLTGAGKSYIYYRFIFTGSNLNTRITVSDLMMWNDFLPNLGMRSRSSYFPRTGIPTAPTTTPENGSPLIGPYADFDLAVQTSLSEVAGFIAYVIMRDDKPFNAFLPYTYSFLVSDQTDGSSWYLAAQETGTSASTWEPYATRFYSPSVPAGGAGIINVNQLRVVVTSALPEVFAAPFAAFAEFKLIVNKPKK